MVEALGVKVEHACIGVVEFGVHRFSNFHAAWAFVAQSAGTLNRVILVFRVVAMDE